MSDIVGSLRETTAKMALYCSVPMGLWQEHSTAVLQSADRIEQLERENAELRRTTSFRFGIGDRVRKTKGSSWQGHVVGFYSTKLTPIGYAVESEREPGSVQIYPESALEAISPIRRLAEQEGTGEATSEEHRLHTWSRGGICDDCGCTFSGLNRVDPCPGRAALREEKCE